MTCLELRDTPDQGTDLWPSPAQRTVAAGDYVRDVNGILWIVREVRPTQLGFALYLGNLAYGLPRGYIARGRPQLIGTPALMAYWHSARSAVEASKSLPVSGNTLPKLCRRLGIRRRVERPDYWRNPLADLKRLPVCEFAELYQISLGMAMRWRARILDRSENILGRSNRAGILAAVRLELSPRQLAVTLGISPASVSAIRRQLNGNAEQRLPAQAEVVRPMPAKWRTPAVAQVLQSGQTDSQNAQALGISPSHSRRLRISLQLHPELSQPIEASSIVGPSPVATQIG